jgi:TolB-like protein/tetratricopeptide (TPR) repeat protein/tRNA A-37 threonylcarbamoyl transferase component Bud32
MTSPAERVIGRVIAERYRVLEQVGSGGMGEVYRAEHIGLKRPTALKFMRPALGGEPAALARFRREAEQASRISHPNVGAIYDFGETSDGLVFLAMEFIEGESLADRIKHTGRLSPADAAHVVAGAAAGLAAAHRRGILHRDLKPANIMLARDPEAHAGTPPTDVGTVKLVDFGIARSIMGEVRPADVTTLSPALTGTGMVLGTPAYASPEQLAGEPLDARSDIYSLGLVAFETLTGEPAFKTSDPRQLIAERLMGSARTVAQVRTHNEAPWRDEVQPVLDKALAARAEHRYADPMELAADLAAALGVPLTPSGPYGPHTPSGEPTSGAGALPPRRSRRALVTALGVAAAGVVGAVIYTRRGDEAARAIAPGTAAGEELSQRIAVLPFENLGRAEEAYVVDGITDEIRGTLASVPGLQVIARASSNEYRGTKKPLNDVARELGVKYLLTGTVRSEPASPGQPARVRVAPELVEVGASGIAPSSRWTQSLDATMADVIAMQADIAGRVAGAMNVALAGVTRARLAEVPTRDPAAYDAYLRGKSIAKTDPVDLRRKLGYFQQAVALDSTFLLAWAERARVASILYSNGVPDPALAREAKAAAERAVALAPLNGIGYGVSATYKNLVEQDPATALTLAEKARTLSPGDPELLRPLAIAERQQGHIDEALQYMRDAVQRDPRNAITVHLYGDMLLWARRYDEAREAADRAVALAPDVSEMIENRAMVSLAQGDLAAARRVLAVVPSSVDRGQLSAAVAMYYDLPWLLDDADERRLLALGPGAFDGDRMSWGWALAQTYALRGDVARTRAYADSALVAVNAQLRDAPNDAQREMVRALLLATLGRSSDALAAGERGMSLARAKWTATNGPYLQHQLARVYMLVGQKDKALDQLEPLLKEPYYLSPAWLKIDPTFAPLRGEARFERLVDSAPVVFGR